MPTGRYLTNPAEIEQTLVSSFARVSLTRATIFDEWRARAAELGAILDTYEEWMGGSFTTDKTDPGDMDVVTIIPSTTFQRVSIDDRQQLDKWTGARSGHLHSFVVVEHISGDPTRRVQSDFDRGYWDRLWSRHKNGGQKGFLMTERSPQ